jgi:murein tripeptide amidase MpaA
MVSASGEGDRVRLSTRGGYNWTKRYPWIVEAALKSRQEHFVIDGEAVIRGVNEPICICSAWPCLAALHRPKNPHFPSLHALAYVIIVKCRNNNDWLRIGTPA